VPTGFQRTDRRQVVKKSRMTSAQHGEDCGLLQRSVPKRAAEMSADADISAGVGRVPMPPHRRRRWGSHAIASVTPVPSPLVNRRRRHWRSGAKRQDACSADEGRGRGHPGPGYLRAELFERRDGALPLAFLLSGLQHAMWGWRRVGSACGTGYALGCLRLRCPGMGTA